MTLHFTISKMVALVFSERLLTETRIYARLVAWARWFVVGGAVALGIFLNVRDGFSWPAVSAIAVVTLGTWLYFPRKMAKHFRETARAHAREAFPEELLGAYEVQFLDEYVQVTTPRGVEKHAWKEVERVSRDAGYLYLFLGDNEGFPIRMEDVGFDTARAAYDLVAERLNRRRTRRFVTSQT